MSIDFKAESKPKHEEKIYFFKCTNAFSKILTKRTFVRLLFLKLNQSRNMKKNFFLGFFIKNQKHAFSGVRNGSF